MAEHKLLAKYPIDFDAVVKGQEFENAELAQILGKDPSDATNFRFAVLGFSVMIRERTGYTCKMTETGLRVLTDPEASEHNWREFGRHRRGLMTRTQLMGNVDPAALTSDQNDRHMARLLTQSRIVQAIEHTRKEITASGVGPDKQIVGAE